MHGAHLLFRWHESFVDGAFVAYFALRYKVALEARWASIAEVMAAPILLTSWQMSATMLLLLDAFIMHAIHINDVTDKEAMYQSLLPQLEHLISGEPNLIANLANISAALKQAFGWFWVGFYLVEHASAQLVLGPFQGSLACTRIPYGRGVCGQAWAQQKSIVVHDVNQHPDHIACSSLSQSEVVVPIYDARHEVVMVLDVDHDHIGAFDYIDAHYLEKLASLLQAHHFAGKAV